MRSDEYLEKWDPARAASNAEGKRREVMGLSHRPPPPPPPGGGGGGMREGRETDRKRQTERDRKERDRKERERETRQWERQWERIVPSIHSSFAPHSFN